MHISQLFDVFYLYTRVVHMVEHVCMCNTEEIESESTRENTPVASTSQNNPVEVQTTTESITPMNLSPNLCITEKRTINSLVTMKKLIPIKKMKKNKAERKPVGIKKANSKILTSTSCRKLVKENHEKKNCQKVEKDRGGNKIGRLQERSCPERKGRKEGQKSYCKEEERSEKKESDTENRQKAPQKENT